MTTVHGPASEQPTIWPVPTCPPLLTLPLPVASILGGPGGGGAGGMGSAGGVGPAPPGDNSAARSTRPVICTVGLNVVPMASAPISAWPHCSLFLPPEKKQPDLSSFP